MSSRQGLLCLYMHVYLTQYVMFIHLHGRSNGLHTVYAIMLGGFRDMREKVFAGCDYWTASASRRYFNKSKPTKQTETMYALTLHLSTHVQCTHF